MYYPRFLSSAPPAAARPGAAVPAEVETPGRRAGGFRVEPFVRSRLRRL